MRQSKMLHSKTVSKLTLKRVHRPRHQFLSPPPNFSPESEFPPLPQISNPGTQQQEHRAASPCRQARSDKHETIIIEQVNNYMYSLATLYISWLSRLKTSGKQSQPKIASRQPTCLNHNKGRRRENGSAGRSGTTKMSFHIMALIVLQWNARSIYEKLSELKQFLSGLTTLPDITCIQFAFKKTTLRPNITHSYRTTPYCAKTARPSEVKVVD